MAVEYREDGWPLCPTCGEDELMSAEVKPAATDVLKCLACNFNGIVPPARWSNYYERRDGRLVSINLVPIDDTQEHVRSRACWCNPAVFILEGGALQVAHNSKDGRELLEAGSH